LLLIEEAINNGKLSGNGSFTKKCQSFFEETYGFGKSLLTTSCTDALEMAAILLEIKNGDEVIMPSFNFVSAANAFSMRGARIKFADSEIDSPNISVGEVKRLISPRTKAIVVVHYAGNACEMDEIMKLAEKNNIYVVEDAAHSIDSKYKDSWLGTIGHLATFSFHETKNISCGEGGMLVINDKSFEDRAEIIWEKGTNRAAFYRGEVNKYEWVDVGSSFLPSEISAAYLFAQLQEIKSIQEKRLNIWQQYFELLEGLEMKGHIQIGKPEIGTTNNAHMFYFTTQSEKERNKLLTFIKNIGALAVFHYLPLHKSPHYLKTEESVDLLNSEQFAKTLIRLPLYGDISNEEIKVASQAVVDYFKYNK
jgi:dTDP-4-amino-4,6-dideoxygalactose transaminase